MITAIDTPSQLEKEDCLVSNQPFITIFQDCIANIKDHLSGTYLFLLTDEEGVLLAMDHSRNLESVMRKYPIHLGMQFTEQCCGVNAISEAMAKRCPVYLPPEDHESPFFKDWHCFSVPLTVGNEIVGYLDVSTIDADMKSELIAIAKLIPADMLISYQFQLANQAAGQPTKPLSERQLKVLELISQGLPGKAIASQLNIKECTVNHHKKVIFEKLGVQSSSEAVSVATRLFLL
ncbi:LuxR C-terminal-related transcriptional regulator [Gorillibacterium sp. CAU 1737]|uniref:helix-turn-helix transcriptional regulator n=1 Tax=Gorillibacterium sp. CAU 1737 TaxID=3140362 RepID=UPI0032615F4C